MPKVNEQEIVNKLLDIQLLVSKQAGHRLQVQEISALFGYVAASGINRWMQGGFDQVQEESLVRIDAVWQMAKGEVPWPDGIKWLRGARVENMRIMKKWHEDNWARVRAEKDAREREHKEVYAGYSLKHVFKFLDQIGEQLDRVERRLVEHGVKQDQQGIAIGKLVKEWESGGGRSADEG